MQAANKGASVQGKRAQGRLVSTDSFAKEDIERTAQLEQGSPPSVTLASNRSISRDGGSTGGTSDAKSDLGPNSTLHRI